MQRENHHGRALTKEAVVASTKSLFKDKKSVVEVLVIFRKSGRRVYPLQIFW